MKYIDAMRGGAISLILFVVAVLLFEGKGGEINDVEWILTISTFLFAILAGFFISRAVARLGEIRKNIGAEDALFLSLYKTAQGVGGGAEKKIVDLIDKYYVITYDNDTSNYYKPTIPYFLRIWDGVAKLRKGNIPSSYEQQLLVILANIESCRNLTSTIDKEKVGKGQWIILFILSMIILICLFYIKTGTIFSNVTTVLLSTSLVMILLILRDLQNLKFGEADLSLEESGQEVLEVMGKLRYYNQKYFQMRSRKIPKNVKRFRLGLHKPGGKLNIRIVENK